MKIAFTKKHFISLAIILVLLLGLFFLLRYLFIAPIISAKETSLANLEIEQKLAENLRDQLRQGNATLHETSINLQKRIPVNPLLDQFLLDLSRAETLSRSYILYVNFNDTEVTDLSDLLPEEEESTEENTVNEEQTAEVTEENTEDVEETEFKVEGLRKITANVSLKALNYEQLAKFLEEVDKLPRIVNIDSVNFIDDTGELVSVDDEVYELYFDVQLSTFYQPNLTDLKGDHPKVDYPNPANKENPLYDN